MSKCVTHHNACDCREEYIKKLEAVAVAAKLVLDHPELFTDSRTGKAVVSMEVLGMLKDALDGSGGGG